MADNKNKPNQPGQSKSETTAAAQTIFNLPQQPQRPITTDNLSKTVTKAVTTAFAQQEKKDLKDLTQGQVTKSKIKTKGQTPSNPAPVASKPKVKLKSQTPHNEVPNKPKVKLKGQTPYNVVPEKKVTLSGASINAIAERLQKLEASKPKVKLKTPTPFNPAPVASKPKVKMKGQTPFNEVPEVKDEKKASANQMLNATMSPLAEKTVTPTAVPIKNPHSSAAINILQSKVEPVEEPVTEKVAPPVEKVKKPEIKYSKEQSRRDALEALKSLGFKKGEMTHILNQLEHIEKTEDKILFALKLKGNPHAKIPRPEVPAAIEKVQKGIDPHQIPGRTIPPAATAPVKETESPKVAPVITPKPTIPDEKPTPASAESNSADSDADQKKVENDKVIEDAKKARKEQEKRDKAIKDELDEIKKKLANNGIADLIAMAIGYLGSKLLKLIGGGLWKLVKLASKAAWNTVKLAWKGAKALFMSIKNLLKGGEKAGLKAGEKVAEKGGEKVLEREGAKIGAEEAAKVGAKGIGKSLLKKIPIIGAIAGLGFAAADLIEGDKVGAGLDAASGFVSILPGIGTAASIGIDAYSAARDLGVTGNKAAEVAKGKEGPDLKSNIAANKLSSDTEPDDFDDGEEPQQQVTVHQDNRKTIVQTTETDESSVLINVRNEEPSASGLVSNLFDHPLAYGAVYRM